MQFFHKILIYFSPFYSLLHPATRQHLQTIIKFHQEKQNLFLAGMTSIEAGDIIDIYSVETTDLSSFTLHKTETYTFAPKQQTKFRYGAGIKQDIYNRLVIVSCDEHIQHQSAINIYSAN